MGKTVIILGAGASAAAGAPIMSNFIDTAERLLVTDRVNDARPSFENLFNGIHALQAIFEKSFIDTDNLESIFAAFEMAAIVGTLPGYDKAACKKLIEDLKRVIVRTLEETTIVCASKNEAHPAFAQFASRLDVSSESGVPTILTFNYDCVLDFALLKCSQRIDYAIGDLAEFPHYPPVKLLKLHGSMNWFERLGQESFEIVDRQKFTYLPHSGKPDGERICRIRCAADRASANKGQPVFTQVPVIVPPTWNKGEHHTKIAAVWEAAARELSEAQSIIVIGYSLPPTDEFFRNLFAIGSIGRARLRRFWVIDGYPSADLEHRYRGLLGRLPLKSAFRLFEVPSHQSLAAITNKTWKTIQNSLELCEVAWRKEKGRPQNL